MSPVLGTSNLNNYGVLLNNIDKQTIRLRLFLKEATYLELTTVVENHMRGHNVRCSAKHGLRCN